MCAQAVKKKRQRSGAIRKTVHVSEGQKSYLFCRAMSWHTMPRLERTHNHPSTLRASCGEPWLPHVATDVVRDRAKSALFDS